MSTEMAVQTQTQEYQIRPYADKDSFELAQRMAMSLTSSTLVPPEFQGERGLGNCLIAMEMAGRMRISPFMCMQSLYVVHGRPSWSSQFIISLVNSSGRFKGNLKYRYSDDGHACTAYAVDAETGEIVEGETVTIDMAKKAGWFDKGSTLWKTAPRQMLAYRAATFFARLHCPDIILGMHTREEIIDTVAVEPEHGTATPGGEKSKRIAGDILGSVATTVVDAQLKPEVNAAPVPPAPKIEPVSKKETEPEPDTAENDAEKSSEPPAHPTAARKIYNKYMEFFDNDRDAVKAALAPITRGRNSKEWTVFTVEELRNRLEELERERAGATKEAPQAEANGEEKTESAAAEEEAAAWL